MQILRAWAIIIVFLTVTLIGIPYQSMALRFGWKRRKTFPHAYHRFMAKLFGVRIKTIGKPLTGEGVLIVANHTSWLDIIVFSAVGHVSFVAKAEVATWPLYPAPCHRGGARPYSRTLALWRYARALSGRHVQRRQYGPELQERVDGCG
jgi:1-acyl-sn-glycerol-3-phosphate acyltransferase